MLPEIAESFGIDTSDRRSLWKDRAVIELTTAVLHSYDQAGMRMDDHYTATEKFQKWVKAEAKKGREVEAEWTWMIPPISASLTPVFHQEYSNVEKLPNFVQSPRADAAPEPVATCPFTGATVARLEPDAIEGGLVVVHELLVVAARGLAVLPQGGHVVGNRLVALEPFLAAREPIAGERE